MNDNRATNTSDISGDLSLSVDVSDSVSSVERHPNLTLLETGQNPGDLLRHAREKAGLSLQDICAQTKINERLLLAIESGDVENMPPETFAKAFIKSYCKALHMDSLPVILSFGFSEGSVATKVVSDAQVEMTRIEASEPKMPKESRRLNTLSFDKKPSRSLGYVIALLALGLLAAFYLPAFLNGAADKPAAVADTTAPSEMPNASEPVALEAPSMPLPEDVAGGSADTPESSAAVTPDPAAPFPALQPQAQAPAQQAPVPSEPQVPSASAPAAAVHGKVAVLKLTFDAPSWITVKDATDQVLVSKLQESGGSFELKGQAPFKVIVGDAKVVKILNNGKPVDLLSSARQGKVARLTIQ
jgi:cytoskeleton protein RodZ